MCLDDWVVHQLSTLELAVLYFRAHNHRDCACPVFTCSFLVRRLCVLIYKTNQLDEAVYCPEIATKAAQLSELIAGNVARDSAFDSTFDT